MSSRSSAAITCAVVSGVRRHRSLRRRFIGQRVQSYGVCGSCLVLNPDGVEPCVGGYQCDAVTIAGFAPDELALAQVRINLFKQALGEHGAHHLGGGTAAQVLWQGQGDVVCPLGGCAEDDGLCVGQCGHDGSPVLAPAVCGGFYRVKPARTAGLLFAMLTDQVSSSVSARMA